MKLGKQEIDLPVVVGTEDEHAIDISRLRAQTGYITLDEGYVQHRRHDQRHHVSRRRAGNPPLPRLSDRSACRAVATSSKSSYLLIYGELPTPEQLDDFRKSLRRHTMLHEDMRSFYNGFPRDAHPMAMLSSVVGALSTFYQDSLNPHDPRQVEISVHRLMAKLPTIAAYALQEIDRPAVHLSAERSCRTARISCT